MSEQRNNIASKLAAIEKLSTAYHKNASELSDFVEWLDKRLCDMPGKVSCWIDTSHGYKIGFDRFSQSWSVLIELHPSYIGDDNNWVPATQASVEDKAIVASHANQLVTEILSLQKSRLKTVKDATQIINATFPKEGE